MSPAILGIWIFLAVFVATLATTVIGARSSDPKWQRRGTMAAIALVVEFGLIFVGLYLISNSEGSDWVF